MANTIPYGKDDIALTPENLKTFPVYITKHMVVEKLVPVPQTVIIEKPYHVPVEKVVPVEKIVHKTVPVPVPVPHVIHYRLNLILQINDINYITIDACTILHI